MRALPLMLLLTLALGALLLWHAAGGPRTTAAHAAAIVERCAEAAYRPACYEEEVPKLLDQGVSFEDAFDVAYEIQALDSSGEYCHAIGHRLGAAETAKDPSMWKEVARRTPLGECLSGGLHGAFQERFKSEWLSDKELPAFMEDMRGFCDAVQNPGASPGDLSMCAHGLGHLFLFITNGDIDAAARLCPRMAWTEGGGVTAQGQDLSCYDGLFMQVFEPHEPEDHALIEGNEQSAATVSAFCDGFSGLAKATCVARSASLFYKEYAQGEGELPRPLDCGQLESERRITSCYETQLRLFARDTFFDAAAADAYCATFPQERRGWCYASMGSFALISGYEYDKPFLFCEHADERGQGASCRRELSRMINTTFRRDDPLRDTLCAKLGEPQATVCMNEAQ